MEHVEHIPLVEVTRGGIVESIHYGAFCVVDRGGKVLAQAGDPELMTYPRSSLKPFQVLPLLEQGGVAAYGLSTEEIAIMCASHAGTALHQSVLEGLHRKIGITEADLACGIHWPSDAETRTAMKLAGLAPTQLHHNCSGKHSGMLAAALMLGVSKEAYLDPGHPVQVSIRKTVAEMVDMDSEEMPLGTDGCSAPVYAIPLRKMAHAVAKMADPAGLGQVRAAACRIITSAMMTSPIMVAGPHQFDSELMIVGGGKLFSKGGAEGYQIIGVMPGVIAEGSHGIGVAIKIADGDPHGRARSSVSLTILSALGILNDQDLARLGAYGNVPVKNWRGLVVGEVRPAFSWVDLSHQAA
jgi:L-asparaginase II